MNDGERVSIGTIVAAILLPPLAIFVSQGLGRLFWIGVLLTIVGWVPGMVFALLVVLRPDLVSRRP